MSPTPTPAASSPLKHIWLCIPPQKLGQVLGMSLPKGWGLAGPGGTTLPSALPPTHPSPLSDPETDPESSPSRTLQLPTRIAGGWWPPSCAFRHKLECRLHCSPWLERHTELSFLPASSHPSPSLRAFPTPSDCPWFRRRHWLLSAAHCLVGWRRPAPHIWSLSRSGVINNTSRGPCSGQLSGSHDASSGGTPRSGTHRSWCLGL